MKSCFSQHPTLRAIRSPRNANYAMLDATRLPHDFPTNYDHVFMNPPYHEATRHDASPKPKKKKANTDPGDLSRWIASAATALKPNATLSLINR